MQWEHDSDSCEVIVREIDQEKIITGKIKCTDNKFWYQLNKPYAHYQTMWDTPLVPALP